MIKNYHVRAVVLKRRNLGETDKIVTLYTNKYGKISAIAKGIRRIQSKKAPHLEVFSHVDLYLACGKSLDIITEAQSIHSFLWVRKDIERVAYAYRVIEQVDRLSAERQQNENVYRLLLRILSQLNIPDQVDMGSITQDFTLALLQELGYLSDKQILGGRKLEDYFEQLVEHALTSSNLISKVTMTKGYN